MVRQVACQVAGCTTGGYNSLGVLVAGPYLSDPDCGNIPERAEDLRQHIVMVHDRDRLVKEAEARQMEAEAEKISAETRQYEAETARRETERGPAGSTGPVGQKVSMMEDSAAIVSTAERVGDFLHLSAVEEMGWCSPMPTGLSPPPKDQHQGQVAGVGVQGVRHMRLQG